MILNDRDIKELVQDHKMIDPFYYQQENKGVISYGLSAMGYDAILDSKFLIPTQGCVLDPKSPQLSDSFEEYVAKPDKAVTIAPHGFVLGSTVEWFKMPSNVAALCVGKSTYARLGLVVNVTPLEPGWEGNVTLELSNTTDLPIRIYPGEGICQFLFFMSKYSCLTPYDKRKGKYMNQQGVTLARL